MDIKLEQPPERRIPDPMDWARGPRVYCDQARLLAPKMGLDALMLISGEVLYRVLAGRLIKLLAKDPI